ncbi:MAG: hypothetical protein E7271_07560 [Lachnospiraceae bacterium]|nr:hypothetical protein [Lachnospiraceae bacterium]
MNEDEIMKKIKEESENIPVPESLSPENMEKMLKEHKDKSKDTSYATPKKRYRGMAIAAGFAVVIIGGTMYATGLFGNLSLYKSSTSNGDKMADNAAAESYEAESDEVTYEDADQAKKSDTLVNEDEDLTIQKELVASGDLKVPTSYEDYYNTISKAIINNYRSVDIDDDVVYEEAADYDYEEETNAASESAMESSKEASFDASAGSSDKSALTTGDSKTSSEDKSDSKNFSTTNTQEKEVDEGDIVKTDGKYIYTANRHGYYYYTYNSQVPTISITRTDNGKLENMSTIELEVPKTAEEVNYTLQEFYLYKNYLVVMLDKSTSRYNNEYKYDDVAYNNDINLNCYINQSLIEIYDISNKSKPKKIKTLYQSGSYESSRISNGYLYTISRFTPQSRAFIYDSIGKSVYSDYVPYINDEAIDYNDIYYSRLLDSVETYVITSVDLNKPLGFSDSKAVSSTGGEVYVGENAIYLYGTIYENIEKTEILKIGYNKGKLSVGGKAMVAGYLYGSFALSEYNGYLRIVSTIPANNFSWYDQNVWKETSTDSFSYRLNENINAVYVLDNDMKLTGRITGIAPGEQIYSARFFGDIGYFVTYRNTDPLFSVDFSDPKNPKIIGALKIPGFSNYLHFYGNDTLLGIGEEIDPYTQNFEGIKLSMFDISDPSNVTESDKFVIKNSYYSSAQYNYKSIMIDPAKNVFGFCYECNEYDGYDDYSYNYYYSTYTFDKDKGFIETARYKILYDYMYDINDVRGIYIGNVFYLVTPDNIQSFQLGSEKQIDNIFLD